MYQISIYDASQTFRLIPNGERYSLTLWANNTVKFTSKRKAFDFIGKVSGLISEALAICEMIHNTVNSFSFHLKSESRSNKDSFNVFFENSQSITLHLRNLKSYKHEKTELHKIIRAVDSILVLLEENCRILNKKNNNCANASLVIVMNVTKSLNAVLLNAQYHFENNTLSLFK
ncbi:hypothetical protein CMT58_15995 [Elizabethkingia anophelis]|uniref:hypothetical protein n=1 Tax=Elizabethkingia anophelis TaxID=1117645 RepID=UPI00201207B9|nr:hypothetical protein [Elizabethkingia anophelis]MCL1640971.1 hypothetical protein [Elizabethkingia anophelis]MCL1646772.1 hypothetical protein [Elizabethkingia anophelis]MDV4007784.1 hypothetical protein [Elizabethkingia anophelis]